MQIIEDYENLHKIPELGFYLPKTTAYIENSLKRLPCTVTTPIPGSVCAYFDFGCRKTLCFRADTDALPIREETGLSYCSEHSGAMHACGHDGHTAILLELARRLPESGYNVLLIFQPGEETEGGAEALCRAGVLESFRVKYIFALHLWPGLPKGEIFSKAGVLMAGSTGVKAEFFGKSVHIASEKAGADALSACCRFALKAPGIVKAGLLKFGKVQGGTAENVLCGKATLWGSLRLLSHKDHTKKLEDLCDRIGAKYGCRGELHIRPGYPAVENPEPLFRQIKNAYPIRQLQSPFLTAEDFSFYQRRIPGCYALLGLGDTPPLHSPRFSFDTKVLSVGVRYFLGILSYLGNNGKS